MHNSCRSHWLFVFTVYSQVPRTYINSDIFKERNIIVYEYYYKITLKMVFNWEWAYIDEWPVRRLELIQVIKIEQLTILLFCFRLLTNCTENGMENRKQRLFSVLVDALEVLNSCLTRGTGQALLPFFKPVEILWP